MGSKDKKMCADCKECSKFTRVQALVYILIGIIIGGLTIFTAYNVDFQNAVLKYRSKANIELQDARFKKNIQKANLRQSPLPPTGNLEKSPLPPTGNFEVSPLPPTGN